MQSAALLTTQPGRTEIDISILAALPLMQLDTHSITFSEGADGTSLFSLNAKLHDPSALSGSDRDGRLWIRQKLEAPQAQGQDRFAYQVFIAYPGSEVGNFTLRGAAAECLLKNLNAELGKREAAAKREVTALAQWAAALSPSDLGQRLYIVYSGPCSSTFELAIGDKVVESERKRFLVYVGRQGPSDPHIPELSGPPSTEDRYFVYAACIVSTLQDNGSQRGLKRVEDHVEGDAVRDLLRKARRL